MDLCERGRYWIQCQQFTCSVAYMSLVVVVTWAIGNKKKYVQNMSNQLWKGKACHNLGGSGSRNAPPETFWKLHNTASGSFSNQSGTGIGD